MECNHRALLAIAVAAGALVSTPAHATPPAGYSLEWSEQFNQGVGLSPSSSTWGYETGNNGFGNQELETYVTDNAHSHIVADPNADDGYALQILATDDNGGVGINGKYTSARINTAGKVMPEYGYVEARIQLPYGQGIWPAFWELGYNIGSVGWPACGEQDIMENIGNSNWWGTNQASLHGPGYSDGNSLHKQYFLPSGQYFYQGYHKFAELWTPTSITFYVDDVPYETRTPADTNGNAWVFTGPAFMIANVAVGGNFPGSPDATTIFPQKMLIDYIKVYTTPYNGPHYIPGVVQAEDFDNGAQGVAYGTTTNTNAGGQYRPELGVGIENTTGGGDDVGWTGAGQWMKYTVNVQATGTYKVVVRAATNNAGGGSFHIEDEAGNNLTGAIIVPNTGGWQNWAAVSATAQLSAGTHTLKLVEDTGGYNLDYIAFTSTSGAFDGPHNLPGVVQSEDYDQGGEGVGFHSLTTTANPAGVYRNDPITVENCAAGGYDISSTAAGQWLKYGVNVQSAGLYNVAFHVASGGTGGKFHILDEKGNNLTGTVTVPGTGGGQNWTFVNAIVNFTVGAHTLQLVEDTGGYSLDYMSFTTAYNGSHYLPATVAVADYDQGGEGIAYHTMAPFSPIQNSYRSSDAVGIESSSLGGNDVGWTQAGQWLDYTVFAKYAGKYAVTFTISSGANGGSFHVQDENGNNLTGAVTVPATGGWQTWQTVTANVTLPAGGQVLRLVEDSGGFNLYSMQFSQASTTAVTGISLSPTSVTGGQSSTATVTLSAPAVQSIGPDGQTVLGGQAVLVASDNVAATIAAGSSVLTSGGSSYLLVATGQSTGAFTVNTTGVVSPAKANISATLGGSMSAALTISGGAPQPPAAPTGLTAVAGNAQASLSWGASAGATSYSVYQGTSAGGESTTAIAPGIASTSYTATGLTNGTKYYFVVKASNAGGSSVASNEAFATPLPDLPSAPTSLTATPGNSSVSLSWTASPGATAYNVYQGTASGGEAATPIASAITGTSYTAAGLTNGTPYYFLVKAVNLAGTSGPSNEVSATPIGPVTYPAGLQLISSPLDFSSASLDTLFGFTGVKLVVWNPSSFSYALTPTAPADHVRLGTGYWVKLPHSVTLGGNGTPADATQNFSIALSAGWNQIGDPFFSSVPVSSLLVNGIGFAQASSGTQPLVSSTLWAYSGSANGGSGGYVVAQSLDPQMGYWVYAYSDVTLQVQHP